LLQQNPEVQSVAFELCGSKVPHLVKYDFELSLEPLFYTHYDGRIAPDQKALPNQNASLTSSLLYSATDQNSKEETPDEGLKSLTPEMLKKVLKEFQIAAYEENANYRTKNHLTPVYWYNHFVVEGKVLYLCDEKMTLVRRDAIYKIKPKVKLLLIIPFY
jgi:hypothetical protein